MNKYKFWGLLLILLTAIISIGLIFALMNYLGVFEKEANLKFVGVGMISIVFIVSLIKDLS